MDDFLFCRRRALDQLTFSQESARNELAAKRASEALIRHARQSANRVRVKAQRDDPPAPPLKPKSTGPPLSSRSFMMIPQDAELHEVESLRENKFLLKSDINDIKVELNPLRQKLRELERKVQGIESYDRYFLAHFQSDTDEIDKAVRERETEQAILKMQKETRELSRTIQRLTKALSEMSVADLKTEVYNNRKLVHDLTEKHDEITGKLNSNALHAERLRASDLYEQVQTNKDRIEQLKDKIKGAMLKHNQLKKSYLAVTGENESFEIEAAPRIIDLKQRLKEEQTQFKNSNAKLVQQKRDQIAEIEEIKQEKKEKKERKIAEQRRQRDQDLAAKRATEDEIARRKRLD
jgi:hypothetical protein